MTNNTYPNFLDTLVHAQHVNGDTPTAIETQQKALLLLPEGPAGSLIEMSGWSTQISRLNGRGRGQLENQFLL